MFLSRSSGQSILELLIGASLIVVVLLGGVILTTKSLQLTEAASSREKAIQLARQGIEDMRAERNRIAWSEFMGMADIEKEFPGKITYTRLTQIEPPTDPSDPRIDKKRIIKVTVSWDDVKGHHDLVQTTQLSNW